MASSPITAWQVEWEKEEAVTDYFIGLQNHYRQGLQPWNQKTISSWQESDDKPRQSAEKQKY